MQQNLSPQDFLYKWQQSKLKESAAAQEHFIDLCRLVGHPTPAESDPTGESFTFEAGVDKQAGGQGWADVWKKNYFAWEYKGKDKNLDAAYQQLLQYRESLLNPPLLVVSDMEQIIIHTNFVNTVKRVVTLTPDDLLTPKGLAQLRAVFYEPNQFKAPHTTEQVTEKAAREFSRLAELLRHDGVDASEAAHFLIRILFCLFAEDVNLLPKDLFTKLIITTKHRPEAFSGRLQQLFTAMSGGGWFGSDEINYFDGGLFDDDCTLPLNGEGLEILAGVCTLDWANIEPSVFGTLFERSLDPSKRSQLGAHYTSRGDILLLVEPVLMAPYRRQWDAVRAKAVTRAEKRDADLDSWLARTDQSQTVKRTQIRRIQTTANKAIIESLRLFQDTLAQVRVLDPACGSGNFLYVALRQLLDLEKEVVTFARDIGVGSFFPNVGPEQLYGIEINEYAHELAQTTIWIGYIQWLYENGFGVPNAPVLKPLDNIKRMDAILAYDDNDKPTEPNWPEANVVIGNPPFLGDKKMRSELGDRYVDNLRALYGNRIPGQSDLVCYWFEIARSMIAQQRLSRSGLLATQGIRGGANRVVLERIKQDGDIFWAQSDRDWILDGATVHVSMVAFDDGTEISKALNSLAVNTINADLTSGADLTSAKTLSENQNLGFIGTQKSGPFDLTADLANRLLAVKGNPNNRPNSDVIKPWINATDITRRPRKMCVIDFGIDRSLEEASQYQDPFEYVRLHVKPKRDLVRRKNHREKWWLFGETRPGMRAAIAGLPRYIATPMVSKYRLFAWVSPDVVAENLIVVIAREDDYFFGVLHSKPHELWARMKGTQLREAESGSRYTLSSTFETYPFPWPPGQENQTDARVQAIAEAAKQLNRHRETWLNPPGLSEVDIKKRTLTNLYNQRPTWLDLAHQKLDETVFAAYGWPNELSDEEILEELLKLNLGRALG